MNKYTFLIHYPDASFTETLTAYNHWDALEALERVHPGANIEYYGVA